MGFCFVLETQSHYVAQAGLKFLGVSDSVLASASKVSSTIVIYHYVGLFLNFIDVKSIYTKCH